LKDASGTQSGGGIVAYHILIEGKVQGVFFRATMKRIAGQHGVVGWVRNRSDGRVESFVQGRPQEVQKVIEWARTGPPGSTVTDFSVSKVAVQPYDTFAIVY
jgi:acylphosphatase